MGNRAVITASTLKTKGLGIYVHWNGGLESVLAFIDEARERGFRDPSSDESYGMARLCGLIHEFFGVKTETSLGLGTLDQLDCNNWDNGVYVIGKDWTIVKRWGQGSNPKKTTVEDLNEDQLEQYNAIRAHLQKLGQCAIHNEG